MSPGSPGRAVRDGRGRRRRPRRAPAVGGRDAARPARRPVREPRHRARSTSSRARVGGGGRGRGAGGEVHAGEGPADDLRAIAALAAARDRPAGGRYGDIVTQREVLAGRSPSRGSRPACSAPAAGRASYGFKTRASRGRVVSRRLALPRRAPPHRNVPGRAQDRARPTGPASRRSPSGWRGCSTRPARRLAGGARPQGRRAGAACSALRAMDREPGDAAPTREVLDTAPLTPEVVAELERRRASAPDDVVALLLVGIVRSGVHVGVSRLRRCSGRARSPRGARARRRARSSSTTRTASCSTRRSRARTASSRRSSSRPTRSTSPAGRRAAG